MATVTAHRELTVTKMVTASRDWAVTWAVIALWPSRDWAVIILKMPAVTSPWLSCDIAVTELWPSRDWAVTSPWLSCDLAVYILAVTEPWSLGPGAVTTVVTVSSRWAHGDHLFSHGKSVEYCSVDYKSTDTLFVKVNTRKASNARTTATIFNCWPEGLKTIEFSRDTK